MASFEERKDAFEKKYAHDQEIGFKIEARCCKLFGLWAGEQMGMDAAQSAEYAKDVVASNLEEPGFDDVKRKVMPDFAAKGLTISDHVVDSMLAKYMDEAKTQIMEELGA